MSQKYYKGMYLISVLADRELPDVSGPEGMINLLNETIDGDLIGSLEMHNVSELSPAAMEQEMWRSGSEPGFFQLGDTLADAEDLFDSKFDDAVCASAHSVLVSRPALNQLMETVGSAKRLD